MQGLGTPGAGCYKPHSKTKALHPLVPSGPQGTVGPTVIALLAHVYMVWQTATTRALLGKQGGCLHPQPARTSQKG